MQSGQINASQLMASFLRSENEKIGQSITRSDFAGELKKFIAAPANDTGAAGKFWGLSAAKPESANAPGPGLQASNAGTQGAPETKTSRSSTIQERKNATAARTKIDAINSKVETGSKSLCHRPRHRRHSTDRPSIPGGNQKGVQGRSESGRFDFLQRLEISPEHSAHDCLRNSAPKSRRNTPVHWWNR